MKLYHYTDEDGLDGIQKAGEIRPASIRVTKDLTPGPASRWLEIGPIVWLTINPVLDGTVLLKLVNGDPRRLCRITVPYICDTGLAEYCDAEGIELDWLVPMVQTGQMAGSNYTTWRLHSEPIPQSVWLSIERDGEWLDP